MDPYKSRLNRKLRLTIMISLFLLFFIISPIVIMYTAGYRYDFFNHEIKETGVLNIDLKPNDADVFLNDVKLSKKIPIYLPNRAPGNYNIKISKPGYKTWEKEIKIESKKTTYIKNLTLLKDSELKPINVDDTKEKIENFYSSTNGKFIFLLYKDNNIYEIKLFDTEKNSIVPISRFSSETKPKIIWSPFADFALIIKNNNNQSVLEIINTKDLKNSQSFYYNDVENIQWGMSQNTAKIYIQNENKQLLSIENGSEQYITKLKFDNWYVDEKNNIWYWDKSNKEIKSEDEEKTFPIEKNIDKFISINENRIIFQDENTTSVINLKDKENNFENFDTSNILYNRSTSEWLTWSNWEIWSIYSDGSVSMLNRTSKKINIIEPMDNYGVILLANSKNLTVFNPGYYISHEILNRDDINITNISVNQDLRKIFLLSNNSLYELDY